MSMNQSPPDTIVVDTQNRTLTPEMRKEVEQMIKKKVGFWIMMNRLGFIYNLIVALMLSGAVGYFIVKIWPVIEQMQRTQQRVENVMDNVTDAFPFFPTLDGTEDFPNDGVTIDPNNPEMNIDDLVNQMLGGMSTEEDDITPTQEQRNISP